jgi:hypothetical protein
MRIADFIDEPIPRYDESNPAHFQWARRIASKHLVEAVSAFDMLTIKNHLIRAYKDKPEYIFSTLVNPQAESLPSLSALTHRCWRALDGFNNPSNVEASVRKARLTVQQAFLFDSLLDYCYLKSQTKPLEHHQEQYIALLEGSSPTDSRFLDPTKHEPSQPFIGHLEIVEAWITRSETETYQPVWTAARDNPDLDLNGALYATALVWIDLALAVGLDLHGTNLICMASDAMHKASVLAGLDLAARAQKRASAKHGLQGSRIRHSKTDELKQWAQAQHDPQQPKTIARRIVHEIPARLQNACNDPQRLIYETILAQRKRDQQGGTGNA